MSVTIFLYSQANGNQLIPNFLLTSSGIPATVLRRLRLRGLRDNESQLESVRRKLAWRSKLSPVNHQNTRVQISAIKRFSIFNEIVTSVGAQTCHVYRDDVGGHGLCLLPHSLFRRWQPWCWLRLLLRFRRRLVRRSEGVPAGSQLDRVEDQRGQGSHTAQEKLLVFIRRS